MELLGDVHDLEQRLDEPAAEARTRGRSSARGRATRMHEDPGLDRVDRRVGLGLRDDDQDGVARLAWLVGGWPARSARSRRARDSSGSCCSVTMIEPRGAADGRWTRRARRGRRLEPVGAARRIAASPLRRL